MKRLVIVLLVTCLLVFSCNFKINFEQDDVQALESLLRSKGLQGVCVDRDNSFFYRADGKLWVKVAVRFEYKDLYIPKEKLKEK